MTKLTDAQTFRRPTFQPQGPDTRCIVNGHALGWDSCTMYAGAMAVNGTDPTKHPTGCTLRTRSGDVTGGTTLRQMADAVQSVAGMTVSTYTGSNVLTPQRVAALVRSGRRVVVQGNADAMIGTDFRSTAGAVNHAVMINQVLGGTLDEPTKALVYDPAADGRPRSYHVDQGPSWWPWSLVKTFCAHLRPTGENGARLGPGKVYVGVFPDSEPHVTLRYGAKKSTPFPDRVKAAHPTQKSAGVYSAPSGGTRLYGVANGTLLVGYQVATGTPSWGSDQWLGNDDGTEWIAFGKIRYEGGTS